MKNMNGICTVRQLITELLDFDLNAEVFIGLGPTSTPKASGGILKLIDVSSGPGVTFGVHIIPEGHLIDADADE